MYVLNIQIGLDRIGFVTSWIGLDWVSENGPMSNSGTDSPAFG